jgi:hypothetical protein
MNTVGCAVRTSVFSKNNQWCARRTLRLSGSMKKTLLLGCLIANASTVCANELAPFTTDGCSLFPNGNSEHKTLWLQCCIQHDMAYWKGGTQPDRLAADVALEQCVNDVGEPEIARIMLAGVRAGGTPYLELNPEEKRQVKTRLQSLESLVQTALKSIHNTPANNPEPTVESTQIP